MARRVAEPQDPQPVARKAKLGAVQLYQLLYRALIEGELKPGDRILETEIASRYNVSRTPVREALSRLEAQGLLAYGEQRGLFVPELDPQSVSELYIMRSVLDGTAAELAAKHANAAEIASLRHMVEHDRDLLDDTQRLAATNVLFHNAIIDCAHNRFLKKMHETLQEALIFLGPTTLSLPGRAAAAIDEHARIVEAIARGDSEAAGAAARSHSLTSHEARLQLMYSTAQLRSGRTGPRDRSPAAARKAP